ncbi:adenylosuccinate lyase [Pseudotenacibaculum haliotis]|uniref:Adenylosuccinate lyase n=1 Tax=Pseudotenacibaculum haliotis TaxID=1862138 RepID=A0ABW5LUQ4_9FLAO
MSRDYLLEQLNNLRTAKRDNRQRVANIVSEQIELMAPLVDITFLVDDKSSIKAAWVLEWLCTHNDLNLILPHLDQFTQQISSLRFDSSIRPCAKICEHLAVAYTNKKENLVKESLKDQHIETIIETGFDWLITPQKIAVRAYTMTTLFYFGTLPGKDWVHPELEHLIRTKIVHESKGCKARGRHILDAIEKHRSR